MRVKPEGVTGKGTGSIWRDASAHLPIVESFEVAHERPRVGQQVVRQQHWLGVLQVSAAGHDGRLMCGGLTDERINELNHFVSDCLCVIEQVEAGQRCDLVVAATACAELAAEVAAEKLDESAFEGGMNILVGLKWAE